MQVVHCLQQGRAGVLKRTTNEQRLMGPSPSDGCVKIWVGGITVQTRNNSVANKFFLWGRGRSSKNFRTYHLQLLSSDVP
jgi:hypothetical protein